MADHRDRRVDHQRSRHGQGGARQARHSQAVGQAGRVLDLQPEEPRPSEKADFYGGLAWIAFGAAISMASWRMDRLERMGVSFFTAPGLVPGVLGVLIAACGIVLATRAWQRG